MLSGFWPGHSIGCPGFFICKMYHMPKVKRKYTTNCKLSKQEAYHLTNILEKLIYKPAGFGSDPFTEEERKLIESLHKQLDDE